ncbi:MAG: phosphatase PAP2 family protein [Gemmatimonadaceae bacterium]
MTTPLTRIRRWLAARFDRHAALGLKLTIGVTLVAGATWLFSALLEEVLDKDVMVRWDTAADAWIHARTTPAGDRLFEIVTLLGSPAVWALAVIVAVALWRRRDRTMLITWSAALMGGEIIQATLKATVRRQRPVFAATYLHGHTWSFPSGHSMGSVLCYATLAWLLTTRWPRAAEHRAMAWSAAAMIIIAVATSRVYLGVHFISDVVGGVLAGTAWVAVCITMARIALERHAPVVETTAPSPRGS